jgi:hypothetical protein
VTLYLQANSVDVRDDHDVYLAIRFISPSDRISLQRAYRIDAENECMGGTYFYHNHGEWPAPDHFDFGGLDVLRSLEWQRNRVVAHLNDRLAHPARISTFQIELKLAEQEFLQVDAAMKTCFSAFDWFVDCTLPVPKSERV